MKMDGKEDARDREEEPAHGAQDKTGPSTEPKAKKGAPMLQTDAALFTMPASFICTLFVTLRRRQRRTARERKRRNE